MVGGAPTQCPFKRKIGTHDGRPRRKMNTPKTSQARVGGVRRSRAPAARGSALGRSARSRAASAFPAVLGSVLLPEVGWCHTLGLMGCWFPYPSRKLVPRGFSRLPRGPSAFLDASSRPGAPQKYSSSLPRALPPVPRAFLEESKCSSRLARTFLEASSRLLEASSRDRN
eukprot:gene12976-biopygen3944